MASGFNERFDIPQDQQETGFQVAGTGTGTGTGTNTTSGCDGINHASLQDWLFADLNTEGYGSATSAASTDPFQTQDRYNVQGADSLPDGTCSLAMLELNHPPTSFMGAGIGPDDAFAHAAEPQPSFSSGAGSLHGFGLGHPLDDSAFPLPDLSTDLPEGQPGYSLDGHLGATGQTRVAPFYAGDQSLAGTPAAFQPIGYQNILAQPSIIVRSPFEDGHTGTIPPSKYPLKIPGHAPEKELYNISWEMRDNNYFCLHAGCRKPSFKRLGDLERHQNNVHTQTKFFWCRYDGCGRGRPFPRKDKRNEHERKVHRVDYTLAENF